MPMFHMFHPTELARPGQWADYVVASPPGGTSPRVVGLRLAFLGQECLTVSPLPMGLHRAWWQMTVRLASGDTFCVEWLTRSADPFSGTLRDDQIERYLLRSRSGGILEYVHAHTGRAIVPEFDFSKKLLPHASCDATRSYGFFSHGLYLRCQTIRADMGHGAKALHEAATLKRLPLDPWVVSGTDIDMRDQADGTIVQYAADDISSLIEVGRNDFVFWDSPQVQLVMEEPAFFVLRVGALPPDLMFPEALYRSNFAGAVSYLDEPAYLFLRDLHEGATAVADTADLHDLTTRFQKAVSDLRNGRSKDSCLALSIAFENPDVAGSRLASFRVREKSIPAYEAAYSHGWYEMAVGVPGVWHQCSFHLDAFIVQMHRGFGVEFVRSPEKMLRLHFAFHRGAARNFDGYWGVGLYGTGDPALQTLIIEVAYAMGATHFMFYSGNVLGDAHVSFEDQLRLTRFIRKHAATHPRHSPRVVCLAARVCLTLPHGYHFDNYVTQWECLWGLDRFGLDRDAGDGATYRQVIATFLTEADRMLRAGIDFDVAFDGPSFHPVGYEEVRHIRNDAQIEITHS